MKKEIWHKHFIEVVDRKGNIVCFEATPGEDISVFVKSVINYLKYKNINGEYTIKFNYKRIKVSRNSIPAMIVNEYLGKFEDVKDGINNNREDLNNNL
ncbi:MAG: hypothetical protein IKC49_01405 [Clostridia bacterium]|nr:hypothetical protein [Clostridia bacterium]